MIYDQIPEEGRKLYSKTSIGMATFIGTPIAGGILLRHNFMVMGLRRKAMYALCGCVLFTLLIIGILIATPEHMSMAVGAVCIIIYTAVVLLVTEKYQGAWLREQEEAEAPFHSALRAAGIGLLTALVYLLMIGNISLKLYNSGESKYKEALNTIKQNEAIVLEAIDKFHTVYQDLEKEKAMIIRAIELDRANVHMLNDMRGVANFNPEAAAQIKWLIKHTKMRIELLEVFRQKNALDINDPAYSDLMEKLGEKEMELYFRLNQSHRSLNGE